MKISPEAYVQAYATVAAGFAANPGMVAGGSYEIGRLTREVLQTAMWETPASGSFEVVDAGEASE